MQTAVRHSIWLTSVVAIGAWLLACSSTPSNSRGANNWQTLFDGKSLEHWTPTGNANWSIANGVVQTDAGNGLLVSKETYEDFEVIAEFWVSDNANSGVMVRCADPASISDTTCYEINIFDKRPDQTFRTGAIVRIAPPSQKIDAGGHWNAYDITVRGTHLVVKLNGIQTVDVNDGKFSDGHIALQGGGGTIKFRSVRVRRLDNK